MRILSVDYGTDTGIALCDMEGSSLYKMYLGTSNQTAILEGAYPVPEECDCIILEHAPFGAKWTSSKTFHSLLSNFQKSGYTITKELKEKGVLLVAPSQWKPFVNRQNIDLSPWSPKTKHERDAMCMLWYAVSMQNKKEKYVFK